MRALLAPMAVILAMLGCAERVPMEVPRAPGSYPQVIGLTANRMIIHRGETVLLRWYARNTAEVTLERAPDPKADVRAEFEPLGRFPARGTLEVRPTESTTYVVSCGNEIIGCSSASVHVIVK